MLQKSDILIAMQNVSVKYGDKKILDNINWTVRKGENWVILGDNGTGKSTLMHLITGGQLQGYSNEIELFGQPKESISMWEIKKHLGIVSTDIMLRYDKQINAYDVILSGFFDSIGLYRKATEEQKRQGNEWITRLHIEELAKKEYHHLSFGQKRLILIVRAIVKSPQLLIVDEPCHGLDHENKKMVLDMLEKIGRLQTTNILLITHNKDEIIQTITNILELKNGRIVRKDIFFVE